MENIQMSISPLLFVMCICGLGVFEYPYGQPRSYLTAFYILVFWLIYSYIIIKAKTFLGKFTLDLSLNIEISFIFAVISALLTLYYNKKFKSCLKKLSLVNNTLEKLGTPKDYADLRAQTIRIIVGWMGLIFTMDVIDSLWFLNRIAPTQLPLALCIPYVVNHALHINTLYDFMNIALLRYIGSRFEHVNRHIQRLAVKQIPEIQVKNVYATYSSFSLIQRHKTNAETTNQTIWTLMHLHNELSSISREFTDIFGWQMFMQISAIKILTVSLILDGYKTVMKFNTNLTYQMGIDIFIITVWAVVVLGKMFIFNYACEELCDKAKGVEAFLNRLSNNTLDAEMKQNITQFLLQLLQKPLMISALGFFHFGPKFIRKFVQCVTMTIIIVLQSIK